MCRCVHRSRGFDHCVLLSQYRPNMKEVIVVEQDLVSCVGVEPHTLIPGPGEVLIHVVVSELDSST